MKSENLQMVSMKGDEINPSFRVIPIPKINNLKQARRAYSKLISEFCLGKISNEDTRTLAYLLDKYKELLKDMDLIKQIESMNERLKSIEVKNDE